MLTDIYDITINLIQYLQNLGDWLIPPMEFFTFLGKEEFYLLVMPMLVWAVDYSFGLRMGVILLLSGSLNSIFKIAFHGPRPYWYSAEVKNLTNPETGFGIPSGHSQSPASIYGLVASTIKRNWVTVVMAVLIFLIGFSRIVLGVHFLQDVLTGWAIGLIVLWLFLRYEKRVTAWFDGRRLGANIGVIFAISVGLVLVGAVIISALGGYELPQSWQENAAISHQDEPLDPLSLNGVITSSAAMFGLVSGGFWVSSRGGYDAGGEGWKRGLRFVIGLLVVVLLWMGLGEIFPRDANLLSYSLRFLRYALVGFWISGLLPVVFVRIGLAEGKKA